MGVGCVERGVLLAANRLLREPDQMVRDQADAEDALDLAASETVPYRSPELPTILGKYADPDGEIDGDRRAAP